MAQNAFDICQLSAVLLASSFHLFGIVLLYRMKRTEHNQTLLIINLSATELLYSCHQSLFTILKILDRNNHFAVTTTYWIIVLSSLTANKLMILYIILDRFADIHLHMKYPIFFTKARVIKIVCALWTISVVYGTTIAILAVWGNKLRNPFKGKSIYIRSYNYVSLTLDAIITLIAVTTYLYFYNKVSSIVKRTSRQSVIYKGIRHRKKTMILEKTHIKKFLIPFLMIATYLLFIVSSTVCFQVRRRHPSLDESTKRHLLDAGYICIALGYLSDAVLYVFLQKSVRKWVIRHFIRIFSMSLKDRNLSVTYSAKYA